MRWLLPLTTLVLVACTRAQEQPVKLKSLMMQDYQDHQVVAFIEFYQKHMPEMLMRIERHIPADLDLSKVDERLRDRLTDDAARMIEFYREYRELEEYEPQRATTYLSMAKAYAQAQLIADELCALPPEDDRSGLEQKLRDQLNLVFAKRLEVMKEELMFSVDKTTELEKQIRKKKRYRDLIVELQYHRMLGQEAVFEL